MTRLKADSKIVRETGVIVRQRPLVVELARFHLRIRPKGAHWAYEVDYESVFVLGAKKAAQKQREERPIRKRRSRRTR
jgi:hypothetical protein